MQGPVTVNGSTYASGNIKEMEGQIIPLGGTIVIFVPVTEFMGITPHVGEEHEFKVAITAGSGRIVEYGPLTRTIN